MFISFPVQMTIYIVSVAMSITILAVFLIKGRKSALLYSFTMFQAVILIWLIRIIVLKLKLKFDPFLANDFSCFSFEYYELYNYKLRHFITCFTGLCWLLFCLLYTGMKIKKYKKFFILLLLLSPIIFYVPVHLYNILYKYEYSYKTLLQWLHIFVRYSYYLIGVAALIKWGLKQKENIRSQAILLSISVLLPVVLNFLQDYKRYVLDTGGIIYDFDVTPVGFILTMCVIAIATYKYRFLDVLPIVNSRLVDNMNQAIVVIDSFNKIVNYNKSFQTTFNTMKWLRKNTDIDVFLNELKKTISNADNNIVMENLRDKNCLNFKGEICVKDSETRYFTVELQSLISKGDEILVRMVCFNDITEYKNLMNEISKKNLELTLMYDQVKEYATTAEELAITKERNRFARDMHDTLGHTLTLLIALLEVSNITVASDSEKTRDKINKALIVARDGMREARRSISGLAPEKIDENSLVNSLDKLVADFRSSDIFIDFTVDGIEKSINRMTLEVLYRACQEAMTNSIRHGLAQHIDVILKFYQDNLKLFIIDDGRGCKFIKRGFGISGMEQRIKNLGGMVVYGSDGENGFNVHIEVPIKNIQASDEYLKK